LHRKRFFNEFLASKLVNKTFFRPFLNCQIFSNSMVLIFSLTSNHSQMELMKGVKKDEIFQAGGLSPVKVWIPPKKFSFHFQAIASNPVYVPDFYLISCSAFSISIHGFMVDWTSIFKSEILIFVSHLKNISWKIYTVSPTKFEISNTTVCLNISLSLSNQ